MNSERQASQIATQGQSLRPNPAGRRSAPTTSRAALSIEVRIAGGHHRKAVVKQMCDFEGGATGDVISVGIARDTAHLHVTEPLVTKGWRRIDEMRTPLAGDLLQGLSRQFLARLHLSTGRIDLRRTFAQARTSKRQRYIVSRLRDIHDQHDADAECRQGAYGGVQRRSRPPPSWPRRHRTAPGDQQKTAPACGLFDVAPRNQGERKRGRDHQCRFPGRKNTPPNGTGQGQSAANATGRENTKQARPAPMAVRPARDWRHCEPCRPSLPARPPCRATAPLRPGTLCARRCRTPRCQ